MTPATFLQSTVRCDPTSAAPTFEASGAVYHEVRRELLVVGDEGDLVALDPQTGAPIRDWCLPGDLDLEGICVADPCSDLVYLLDESAAAILEFDLLTSVILRRFDLTQGGYEAIEFVPDPRHPHGGTFYVGLQTTGTIRVFELPLRDPTSRSAVLVNTLTVSPPVGVLDVDFRGFDYDADRGVLYAISRTNHLILAIDLAGNLLQCWRLERIAAHEGLAIIDCTLYSTIDTSSWSIEVHTGFPSTAACDSLHVSATTVSIDTGGSNQLVIEPGVAFANQLYLVLGSISGASPGFDLGALHVPLVFDAYTECLLANPNPVGAFALTSLGRLDAAGRATTTLVVPPLPELFLGVTLRHASLFFDASGVPTGVSNSAPLCVRR